MSILTPENTPDRSVPAEDVAIIFREDGTVDLMIPVCTDDDKVTPVGLVAGALYTLMQNKDMNLVRLVRARLDEMTEQMHALEMEDMEQLPSINGGGKCPTN